MAHINIYCLLCKRVLPIELITLIITIFYRRCLIAAINLRPCAAHQSQVELASKYLLEILVNFLYSGNVVISNEKGPKEENMIDDGYYPPPPPPYPPLQHPLYIIHWVVLGH